MARKRVRDFELTLAQSDCRKEHVFYALEDLCDQLLVAEERHEDGGRHYHCYLQWSKKAKITDIVEAVEQNVFGDDFRQSIHVSSLRNAQHWIKYCTKEDTDPICKNMDTGRFHQAWKLYNYIRHHEEFDTDEPFIRQNPSLVNILRTMHNNYWAKKYHRRTSYRFTEFFANYNIIWAYLFKDAYERGENIILYGRTGVGKTTVALETIGEAKTAVLQCGKTDWEFGAVTSDTKVILAGDAPGDYVMSHRSTILQLADKGRVTINVKCAPIKTIVFRGQIIIISNDKQEVDAALERRFIWIQATEDAFQTLIQAKTEVPEEVPEDETIYISSEDEEEECICTGSVHPTTVSDTELPRTEDWDSDTWINDFLAQ